MQCLPSLKAKTAYAVWPRLTLVHGQPGGVEVSGLLARAYVRRRQARGHSERRSVGSQKDLRARQQGAEDCRL